MLLVSNICKQASKGEEEEDKEEEGTKIWGNHTTCISKKNIGTPSPKGVVKAGLPSALTSTRSRSPIRGPTTHDVEGEGCCGGF